MVNLLYPQAHKATVGGSKDRIMILFKTTLTRDYSKPTRAKNIYGGGKTKEFENQKAI